MVALERCVDLDPIPRQEIAPRQLELVKERNIQLALIAVAIVRLRLVDIDAIGRVQLRRDRGPGQVLPVLDLIAMHEHAAVERPPAKE